MSWALPTWIAEPIPTQCYVSFAKWSSNKMAGLVGSARVHSFCEPRRVKRCLYLNKADWKRIVQQDEFYSPTVLKLWENIISWRKSGSRDWTDEYKHHNIVTNFDIFIAVSSKSLRSLKSMQECYIVFRCWKIESCDWTRGGGVLWEFLGGGVRWDPGTFSLYQS